MGSIYLQTSGGKNIHLPIVGADFNTPDSPVLLNVSVLGTRNRCYSGQVAIIIPTMGTITFDFDPPGRTGTCNQCGQCCSHPVASCPSPGKCDFVVVSGIHRCQYLTVLPKGIGKANGTECSIRATIFNQLKGCVLFPTTAAQIANCPACGFSFSG